MNIGAADIDLQPAHLWLGIQLLAGIGVVLYAEAGDVGHHRLAEALGQPGQLPGNHSLHAGILQAHGVDHAAGALCNPGGGVAEARLPGGSLKGEGAQPVDVVQLSEFIAVAEGAGGGNHRVVQRDAAEANFGVHQKKTSSRGKTGPSLQTRLAPLLVWMEQPMQAPKPQPMRSSMLYCPAVETTVSMALNMGRGPQA